MLSATLMQDKYTGRVSEYNGEDNIWTRCQALNGVGTFVNCRGVFNFNILYPGTSVSHVTQVKTHWDKYSLRDRASLSFSL